MNEYHFDIGNTNTGPLGLCARVAASSKAAALAILRQRLPEVIELKWSEVEPEMDSAKGEYINVYINPDEISEKDLSDSDPLSVLE